MARKLGAIVGHAAGQSIQRNLTVRLTEFPNTRCVWAEELREQSRETGRKEAALGAGGKRRRMARRRP
jgi:hypothetical protein